MMWMKEEAVIVCLSGGGIEIVGDDKIRLD
jgi:hypothetical protein